MIDRWIDVGVEPIGLRILALPCVDRLPLHEAELHDRLDALEPVLPRDDQSNRCAVLVRQDLAVESDRKNRQWMHRLVEAPAFDVRPLERVGALLRKLSDVMECVELYEAGFRCRLDALDDVSERNTDPRDDQRPGFDAAEAINALLEHVRFDEVFERVRRGLGDVTLDGNLPWTRTESAGEPLRTVTGARIELVEIVEAGDVVVRVWRLGRTQRTLTYIEPAQPLCGDIGPAQRCPRNC